MNYLLWALIAAVVCVIYALGSGPSNNIPNVGPDGFER